MTIYFEGELFLLTRRRHLYLSHIIQSSTYIQAASHQTTGKLPAYAGTGPDYMPANKNGGLELINSSSETDGSFDSCQQLAGAQVFTWSGYIIQHFRLFR